jgi:hypothetical protein
MHERDGIAMSKNCIGLHTYGVVFRRQTSKFPEICLNKNRVPSYFLFAIKGSENSA